MSRRIKKEPRALTIRWTAEEWERLEQAAIRLQSELGFKVAPSKIIKSGAAQRAEEILSQAAA
ncbi:MAG: hypothetical protein IT352_07420 [Gemmatimonadales bacterium]|nr:hypothetical protein [Gemmatimonadales bacterium]